MQTQTRIGWGEQFSLRYLLPLIVMLKCCVGVTNIVSFAAQLQNMSPPHPPHLTTTFQSHKHKFSLIQIKFVTRVKLDFTTFQNRILKLNF